MNVHETQLEKLAGEGWTVIVEMHAYPAAEGRQAFTRYTLADPTRECCQQVRGGSYTETRVDGRTITHYPVCTLDKDHGGYHSAVTFYCDVCSKTRRGTPYRSNEDISVCFLCQRAYENDALRGRY